MSSPPTPGTAAENERYVLFSLQCCMQEMTSGLKLIDAALEKITKQLDRMKPKPRIKKVEESVYYADCNPGTLLRFS
jgi:hypothetical protein